MIAGTFAVSGLLLLITAGLFAAGFLTPVTQTIAWFSIFFFASAAASSAYLTASEIFPLETRALAIACFYALGTAIGGSTSPLLFGWLIQSGSALRVSGGVRAGCRVAADCRRDRMDARNRCGRKISRKHRGSAIQLVSVRLRLARAEQFQRDRPRDRIPTARSQLRHFDRCRMFPSQRMLHDACWSRSKRDNGEHHGAFDGYAARAASCRSVRSPVGDRNTRRGTGDWQFHAMDHFTLTIKGTGR